MTSTSNTLKHAPDLNTHAPRSARVRLGNFAILPRLLDKCRADIIGKIGEYQTNCTIDKEFLTFTAISYDQLRAELQKGKGDGEILKWIHENSKNQRTPWEINQWSEYQGIRSPEHHTRLANYFLDVLKSHNSERGDITSWVDLLDLDDFCSFGGQA